MKKSICDWCDNQKEAHKITLRQHKAGGLPLVGWQSNREYNGCLCASCMARMFRKYQKNTLVHGWRSIRGLYLAPYILITNKINYLAVRQEIENQNSYKIHA